MEKKKAIIIDLEGTLSDHSHRKHHWENKNYQTYNSLFSKDIIMAQTVKKLCLDLSQVPEATVIICTAKSEVYMEDIKTWLYDNLFGNSTIVYAAISKICCRMKGDMRPSPEVKESVLIDLMDEYTIIRAYDDREDVCEVFEKYSIPFTLVVEEPEMSGPATALRFAADVFESRDKEYGSSYKTFGQIMTALFPNGLTLKTASDFARFGVFNTMISKTHRYTANWEEGHKDSLDDLSVYSQMLNDLDRSI